MTLTGGVTSLAKCLRLTIDFNGIRVLSKFSPNPCCFLTILRLHPFLAKGPMDFGFYIVTKAYMCLARTHARCHDMYKWQLNNCATNTIRKRPGRTTYPLGILRALASREPDGFAPSIPATTLPPMATPALTTLRGKQPEAVRRLL